MALKKPDFKYSKFLYTLSAILAVPLLIDICCACHLFSLWVAWILFAAICLISIIRIINGFRQKCYPFIWGLFGQLLLGAGVLIFFQLSYTDVIDTPVSHPLEPAVVDIAPPVLPPDSLPHHEDKKQKEHKEVKEKHIESKLDESKRHN